MRPVSRRAFIEGSLAVVGAAGLQLPLWAQPLGRRGSGDAHGQRRNAGRQGELTTSLGKLQFARETQG